LNKLQFALLVAIADFETVFLSKMLSLEKLLSDRVSSKNTAGCQWGSATIKEPL